MISEDQQESSKQIYIFKKVTFYKPQLTLKLHQHSVYQTNLSTVYTELKFVSHAMLHHA